MPGSFATFTACSYTFRSIALMSASLPKMMAGTRISPAWEISHSYSDRRAKSLSSMVAATLLVTIIH
jgi:hypothetical protein